MQFHGSKSLQRVEPTPVATNLTQLLRFDASLVQLAKAAELDPRSLQHLARVLAEQLGDARRRASTSERFARQLEEVSLRQSGSDGIASVLKSEISQRDSQIASLQQQISQLTFKQAVAEQAARPEIKISTPLRSGARSSSLDPEYLSAKLEESTQQLAQALQDASSARDRAIAAEMKLVELDKLLHETRAAQIGAEERCERITIASRLENDKLKVELSSLQEQLATQKQRIAESETHLDLARKRMSAIELSRVAGSSDEPRTPHHPHQLHTVSSTPTPRRTGPGPVMLPDDSPAPPTPNLYTPLPTPATAQTSPMLSSANEKTVSEWTKLADTIRRLQQQLNLEVAAHQTTRDQLAQSQKEAVQARESDAEVTSKLKLSAAMAQIGALERDLDAARYEAASTQAQLAVAQRNQHRVDALAGVVAQLHAQADDLNADTVREIRSLEDALASERKRVKQLQAARDALRQTLDQANLRISELERELAGLAEQAGADISSANRRFTELQTALDASESERTRDDIRHTAELRALSGQLGMEQENLRRSAHDAAEAHSMARDLQRELDFLRQKNAQYVEAVAQLEAALAAGAPQGAAKRVQQLEKQLRDQQQRHTEEIDTMQEQLETLKSKLHAARAHQTAGTQ